MQAVNNVRTQPNRSAIRAQLETLVWLRASTPFVLLIAGLSDPITITTRPYCPRPRQTRVLSVCLGDGISPCRFNLERRSAVTEDYAFRPSRHSINLLLTVESTLHPGAAASAIHQPGESPAV